MQPWGIAEDRMLRKRVTLAIGMIIPVVLLAYFAIGQFASAKPGPAPVQGSPFSVAIDDVSVGPGTAGFLIPVRMVGIPAPGLGSYSVIVNYDPSVITIDAVLGGEPAASPFNGPIFPNLNTPGEVRFNGFNAQLAGPTGNFIVANLRANALGTLGSATTLVLTITALADAFGLDFAPAPATVNGSVSLVSLNPPPVLTSPDNGAVISEDTPLFVWQVPPAGDFDSYELQVALGNFLTGPFVLVVDGIEETQHQVEAADALSDGTYQWRVRTEQFFGEGVSDFSDPFTFTVDRTPPGAPTLVSPTGFTNDTTPIFDWNAPALNGVVEYVLQVAIGDVNIGPYAIDVVVLHPVTGFETIAPLADGTYQWRVIAKDAAQNTASSLSNDFTVDTVLTAPDLISPVGGAAVPPLIDLDWSGVIDSSPVTYDLEVDDDPDFISTEIVELNLTGSNFTVAPGLLQVGITYNWRVTARDAAQNVRTSTVETFTVVAPPPLEPPVLVSPEDGELLITATPVFTWNAPTIGDVLDYTLQVTSGDINDGPYVINIGELTLTQFEVQPGNELGDAAYRWRVIARDAILNKATSASRIFAVSTAARPDLPGEPLPPVPVQIRVGPPDSTPYHTVAGIGVEFDAEIWIVPTDRNEEVVGAEVHFNFDPELLEVLQVVPNPDQPLPLELTNQFDNTLGHVDYAAGILTGTPPRGDFLLATVEFRVKPDAILTARTDVDLALSFTDLRKTFVQGVDEFLVPFDLPGIPREGLVTISTLVFNGKMRSLGTAPPPGIRHILMLTVTFTQPGTGTSTGPVVETFTGIISDRKGRFVVDLEDTRVNPGSYDVRVKGTVTLSNLEEDLPIPQPLLDQPVDFGSLRPGDLDLSDIVNITDFVLLTLGFGQGGETPKNP